MVAQVAKLPDMVEGGMWIQTKHAEKPVYVTHPEHIKRMIVEGHQPIAGDPRTPDKWYASKQPKAIQEQPTEQIKRLESEVDELKRETATLQDALKRALAALQDKSEQPTDAATQPRARK